MIFITLRSSPSAQTCAAPFLVPVQPKPIADSSARTDTTKFTYQLLAGVDFTIFPRIDWRIVEFSYGGFTGLEDDFHPKTLSMGFVVRLP
jgi:hypothetical protein